MYWIEICPKMGDHFNEENGARPSDSWVRYFRKSPLATSWCNWHVDIQMLAVITLQEYIKHSICHFIIPVVPHKAVAEVSAKLMDREVVEALIFFSLLLLPYLSIYVYIYIHTYTTYLSIYLQYLSVYLFACSSTYLCLSVCLSISLSIYLSVCLSVYLSPYLSIYLPTYLSSCLIF